MCIEATAPLRPSVDSPNPLYEWVDAEEPKQSGLVIDDRAGSRRIYRVNQSGLRQMRAELDTFWNDTLTAYKHAVEQPNPTSNEHTNHDHPPQGENR